MKGFKTAETKRGGQSGFTLVKDRSERTLGMLVIGKRGLRLEGSRVERVTIESAADVKRARAQLTKVDQENERKDKERAAKKTRAPAIPAKSKSAARAEHIDAKAKTDSLDKKNAAATKRARSRANVASGGTTRVA